MDEENESLRETQFWLDQPGILEDIATARKELEDGLT